MKRILCLAALAFCGCAYTGEGVTVRHLYRPALLGDRIGDVIRVEDEDAVYVYVVNVGSDTKLEVFMKPGSKLTPTGSK